MQYSLKTLIALICVLPLGAAQREVGTGQAYTTISACISAAANGDICNVRAGTYRESINFGTKQITVRANPGDTPILIGAVELGWVNNATLDGFDVQAPSSAAYGVHADGGSGVTVKNNKVHGAKGYGIYFRNSTKALVQNNEVFGNTTGIGFISCHSTDNTYANGCIIDKNTVYGNPEDGLEGNGEYVTVSRNNVYSNIDTNYLANHPDGLQMLAGCADGYCATKHWMIYSNTFKNHTQNIFVEGINSGQSSDAIDTWIFNNVCYMDAGTVNGVNLDSIYISNVVVKYAKDAYIFNNYLGRAGNVDILVQDSYNGSVHIKNNVLDNSLRYGVSIEDSSDVKSGELDYNFYRTASTPIILAGKFYSGLSSVTSLSTPQESHGKTGDPMVNAIPSVTIKTGSPLIGAGVGLSGLGVAALNNDRADLPRGTGGTWDIGPYKYSGGAGTPEPGAPLPPTGLSAIVN